MTSSERKTWLIKTWFPWLILGAFAGLASRHVLDYSEARELDFPRVSRPFFNPFPPAAYRLAEPGDTLDRVGLYFAAIASAISLVAIIRRIGRRSDGDGSGSGLALWPAALALSLAASWHASTPRMTIDGWHGLGWRVLLDPAAPGGLRLGLFASALILSLVVVLNLWAQREDGLAGWLDRARSGRVLGLLVLAVVLVPFRQIELPGLGPEGYWPRCCFDLGLLAFVLALARSRPLGEGTRRRVGFVGMVVTALALAMVGIGVTTYHRPLGRLHAVVPGKIYISAMPSYRGLAIEQERLHFRTIINLFDEASTQGSPHHDDEIRFVRDYGLRYLGSPSDGLESDRFLDETLALAQNPEAWPILIHCHGCMDRSPAWMGLYRFLIEGKPLDTIFAEIERHRGSRAKAIVTLQYNRKLSRRAPERFASDPTGQLIRQTLAGTVDPFLRPNWNPTATTRQVVTRIEPDPSIRRP